MENTKYYIEEFKQFSEQNPGPVPFSVQFKNTRHNAHIVFSAIVHGNEVGSIPSIISIIKQFIQNKIQFGGTVTFVLGNIPAALENKRYIEEDLNRAFHEDSTLSLTIERKRALELKPLLKTCNLLFDFHQTKLKTQYPFYAFGYHYESYLWARAAGVTRMFVTREHNQRFSSAGLCIDEYVRNLNIPAVTLELSQKGFNRDAEVFTELAIKRVLKGMDQTRFGLMSLKKLARKNRDLCFLKTTYKEPFSHPKKYLNENFVNFMAVAKEECLGFDENQMQIVAPDQGFLMFPKYPERDENNCSLEKQSELFLLVKPTNSAFYQK